MMAPSKIDKNLEDMGALGRAPIDALPYFLSSRSPDQISRRVAIAEMFPEMSLSQFAAWLAVEEDHRLLQDTYEHKRLFDMLTAKEEKTPAEQLLVEVFPNLLKTAGALLVHQTILRGRELEIYVARPPKEEGDRLYKDLLAGPLGDKQRSAEENYKFAADAFAAALADYVSEKIQARSCIGCGRLFKPSRTDQVYHDDRCRKAFNERQRRAAQRKQKGVEKISA